jgi:hypothetical protein
MIKVNVDTREVRKMLYELRRFTPDLQAHVNKESAETTQRMAEPRVPKLNNDLRESAKVTAIGKGDYMLIYKKPYAQYQERGKRADGTRIIRKWTTPGTGPNYASGTLERLTKDGTYRRIAERWVKKYFKNKK